MKRLLWPAILGLLVGASVEGCDRCAGVLGCVGEPRLSLDGQLIVRETGAGVSGASLAFVRTGGVPLLDDSVTATTDREGRFQLAVGASALGTVLGDLVVRPPAPWHPYRVSGVAFPTSDLRGQGQILGELVVSPYVEFLGALSNRSAGGPLAGARVTIVRTGGVGLVGPDSFDITANSDGVFYFNVEAQNPGDLIADMIVQSPALPRAFRRAGIGFPARYQFHIPEIGGTWIIGDWLPYVGVLYHRGSLARSAGITVLFQRTGGIPVQPDTFAVQTNTDGYFALSPTPLAEGEVVGDLIVQPPAPEPAETIRAQRLTTSDTDQQVLLGVWGYGYGILYGGTLYMRGTGAPVPPGLAVTFRRTGGIAISPDGTGSATNTNGAFALGAAASGPGDVIGDITIVLPAPFPPDTITGVHVPAFASDEMRFLGRWGVGPSLNYAAVVQRADNDSGVAGAVVQFQRTGGIQVTPAVLVDTTDALGRMLLVLNPLAAGEVTGTVYIHPPAPFRDTTFTGVSLQTFDNDSLRLAGVFRIAPPP